MADSASALPPLFPAAQRDDVQTSKQESQPEIGVSIDELPLCQYIIGVWTGNKHSITSGLIPLAVAVGWPISASVRFMDTCLVVLALW